MSNEKITLAMRKWCEKLADPNFTLIKKGRSTPMYYAKPYPEKRPSIPMIQSLIANGLVEFWSVNDNRSFSQAQLTEKGMKIAKGEL